MTDIIIVLTVYLAIIGSIIFGKDFKLKTWTSPRLVVAPLLGIILIILLTAMKWIDLVEVIRLKAGLVVLILSFAYLANSLDESGFFEYIALRIVNSAHGSGKHLFIFFFLMTSVLTYFTSNDVIILSITPILLYVGKNAGIRDMVPYLMAQFIAANTLSMGLYIGSPTNIVLGDALGLNFFTFFHSMLLPSITATIVTLGVLYYLFYTKRFLGHGIQESYTCFAKFPPFTFEMLMKATWFILCLMTLAFNESLNLPLWQISLGFALLILSLDLIVFSRRWGIIRADDYRKWYDTLIFKCKGHIIGHLHGRMPYTIVPFVFGFFFFVQAMSRFGISSYIANHLFGLVADKGIVPATLFYGLVSSLFVNLMNDIPATVFLSDVLQNAAFKSDSIRRAAILATAVGVNVGCYITYIGALAGIMWFKLIENQKMRGRIDAITPTKKEFFLIGIIVAPLVILSACVVIILQIWK
ncbi:MAG: hypothetical protein JXR56_00025 [Candidatus Cloacimonetes bacterium]|nr:hypothetical protein [Candidatus Cloacimonadota bacterium]